MVYSTLTDITDTIPEETVIQLTDEAGINEVDQQKVDKAILRADSLIDSYCGKHYTVPFSSPIPELISTLSVDIAIYFLYGRNLEEMTEVRSEGYKNAIALLKDISKGLSTLGVDTPPEPASQGSPEVQTKDRLVTRESLQGF